MALYALKKHILSLTPKPRDFLQGLSSNVWDAPQNAFLDTRGRIVATADQLRITDDEVWEIVEEPFAERLKTHLAKYLLLGDTRLESVSGWRAYYDPDGDHELPAGARVLVQKAGQVLLSQTELEDSVSDEEFVRFRLDHGIAVQGMDYDEEMLLNLGDERYVSYSKGCFLGQEIIARVRYRAKPPRKLCVVEMKEGDPKLGLLTSRLRDEAAGVIKGFLFRENA